MNEPTRPVPVVGGPPPVDPPDGPPPRIDEPVGPSGGGPDRRILAIGLLLGVLALLIIALVIVRAGGDDSDLTASSSSTTAAPTATVEPTTTSGPSTTSTTAPTTTSTSTTTTSAPPSTTTTTTTTTTTAAPVVTIAPSRCRGTTGPDDPDPVAVTFYDAWRADDRACARKIATDGAIATLFQVDGAGAQWVEQGCFANEDQVGQTDCAYSYEGGAAFFEMHFGPVDGWRIFDVRFVAD